MDFEIRGRFRNGDEWRTFKKVVSAHNERFAREKVLSLIGSHHKVKRNLIKIEEVKPVDEVS
jgi:large subunit ribosomal protein LX